MSTRKNQPSPTRGQAEAKAASFGGQLRDWLHAQRIAAGIRNRKRRKNQLATSRGVDRVPERLRGLTRTAEWVHLHTSPSRAMVRRTNTHRGKINQPYTNPMRDVKALRSGRLRKELQP